jgi:ribonuclease D
MYVYQYIENSNQLDRALKELGFLAQEQKWIGVDTEFYRVHTYWPILSLIQISAGDQIFLFDVLSLNDEIFKLSQILCDPSILKLFHSAEQDLGILNKLFKKEVAPAFDTQIAARLCGLGHQIGYANLVEAVLHIKLSKEEQFSQWLLRPLRQEQLFYASLDVLYLGRLYEKMKDIDPLKLKNAHILLEGLILNEINGPSLLKKIKRKPSGKKHLAILEKLVLLREEIAQKDDTPRQKVMSDRLLLDLVARTMKHYSDLDKIPGFRPNVKKKWGDTVSKLLIEERKKALISESLEEEADQSLENCNVANLE